MRLHFLKTAWSDIILLEHNDEFAMIDTGFAEQFPKINRYLTSLGVKHLSFILNTHFHRDHYGAIPEIIKNYKVDRVYLKEYSGLDITTAWGTPADDDYRTSEMDKFHRMQETIAAYSTLIPAESISEISFAGVKLELFFNTNTIREIYEDASYPETYHKICFSENQNSLAAFLRYKDKTVFFGGDIQDLPSTHPKANYVNLQIARKLNCSIDVYKVPHHGTYHTGCAETLAIYRPQIAVITNEEPYLVESSDVLQNLKAANPEVDIRIAENGYVVIDL